MSDDLTPDDQFDPKRAQEAEREAEHARKMAELFGDLDDADFDDEPVEETVETLSEDRDDLKAQVDGMQASLKRTQGYVREKVQEHEQLKQQLAQVEGYSKVHSKFAGAALVADLTPIVEEISTDLNAITAEERAENAALKKVVEGFEKALCTLRTTFNKHSAKPDEQAPPAAAVDAGPADDTPPAGPGQNDDPNTETPETDVAQTIEALKADIEALQRQSAEISMAVAKAQQEVQLMAGRCTETQALITRTEASVESEKTYAVTKAAKDILPSIDTLELGLSSIKKKQRRENPALDQLATKIQAAMPKIMGVFNKHSITQMNPKGEAFDSELHEALSTAVVPDVEEGTVLDVPFKGYKVADRVIRNAKVVVAAGE